MAKPKMYGAFKPYISNAKAGRKDEKPFQTRKKNKQKAGEKTNA